MLLRILPIVLVVALSFLVGATGAPEKTPAEKALDRVMPEVNFNEVTLSDIVDFIRDITGVSVDVNWEALAKSGVVRDKSVTMRVKDRKLGDMINDILKLVRGNEDLAFKAHDSSIEISTAAELSK